MKPKSAQLTVINSATGDVVRTLSLGNGPNRPADRTGDCGAIGSFDFDTTTLSNGIHTVAWRVTDSAGNSQGIGSRYFYVQNGG